MLDHPPPNKNISAIKVDTESPVGFPAYVKAFTLKDIALAGLIAALYAVLGLVFLPISFGVYQVRVAEVLTVLPFLTRAAVPGLFIGCMLANVYGGMGWQDIVFGSLITLAAAILTRLVYYLSRSVLSDVISSLPVILLWAGGLALVCYDSHCMPVIGLAVIAALLLILATRPKGRPQPSQTVVYALRLVSGAALVGAIVYCFGTHLRRLDNISSRGLCIAGGLDHNMVPEHCTASR